MKYVARPPQRLITNRIIDQPRVNIWAPMGFGKTGAVLDALDRLSVVDDEPTLQIGPKAVAEVTWPDEVAKWDHLAGWRVSPVLGDPAARAKALRTDANLYTVNFENLPWLVDQFKGKPHGGSRWPFRKVIFDEAIRLQGFRLKQGSAQAAAIGKVAHNRVDRWISLTGAPAPNGLKSLWGQNWFIDEGRRLGRTHGAFQERWFQFTHQKIEMQHGGTFNQPVWKPVAWAQEEIEELIADVTLSLDVRTWFPDLREPIKIPIPIRLPPKARAHYTEMEKKFFTEIRGHEIEAVHAASKSMKCLQIASGAVFDAEKEWHHVHDAKLDGLHSVIAEGNGANVLVVYQWKPTLARLLKAFPKRGVHIHTAATIRAWQRGEISLGFVHPKSVGHGQSLQDGGNIICHFDQWWDLDLFDQVNERLGAMRQMQSGHDRDVFEYYLVAQGTLDEDVLDRHETKRTVQDSLRRAIAKRGGGR